MIPDQLQTIIDQFKRAPKPLRLQLLLEYAGKVEPLPENLVDQRDQMEQVHECQTPFFLLSELDDEGKTLLHFDVPKEAPTTRGFAGILTQAFEGLEPATILEAPSSFYNDMGLGEVISPLRLRGMSAIVGRLKGQLEDLQSA